MELLQRAGVAAGVVANSEDMDRDPQLQARGYSAQVSTPEGENVILDSPQSTSLRRQDTWLHPPLLENIQVVLHLLGYSAADIAKFKAERVVASNAEIMVERAAN